jgi:hypothetical protein
MRYQFDCRNSTYKVPNFAGYGEDGSLMGALNDDQDWTAVNPQAASADIMDLACNGNVPADMVLEGDVQTIVTEYRAFVLEQ